MVREIAGGRGEVARGRLLHDEKRDNSIGGEPHEGGVTARLSARHMEMVRSGRGVVPSSLGVD